MRIGNVEIENPVALGPMAGVTDYPFRLLCKEMGCGLLYTEMVSAKAVLYHNKNTEQLLRTDESEHPIGVQIFGSDPEIMADIGAQISEHDFDFVDVNMGCPVPKIVNNQEGSALMKNPELAAKIIRTMTNKIKKPVTVKFRSGFTEETRNAVEFAKRLEDAGVSAIAVHGRTREQYYSGKADWDIIRQVKEAVRIPVIGNGDITNPEEAKQMLEQTGCDGIMIGRAARGNPWIFKQVTWYLKTGELLPGPSVKEVRQMILRHAKMQVEEKGDYIGIREMRKHVQWYTTGLHNAASLRAAINQVESIEELEEIVEEKLEALESQES